MRLPEVEGCEFGGVWAVAKWAVWRRMAREVGLENFMLSDWVDLIATVVDLFFSVVKLDSTTRDATGR